MGNFRNKGEEERNLACFRSSRDFSNQTADVNKRQKHVNVPQVNVADIVVCDHQVYIDETEDMFTGFVDLFHCFDCLLSRFYFFFILPSFIDVFFLCVVKMETLRSLARCLFA